MNCPECNNATISKVEGSSLVIECQECGWSIATSHIDPIYEDETIYSISTGPNSTTSKEALKAVSRIVGGNFISAKRLLETPGSPLIEGKAPVIKECLEALACAGVDFDVKPAFPF